MTYFRPVKDEEITKPENKEFLKGYQFCLDRLREINLEPCASVNGDTGITEIPQLIKVINEIAEDTITECVEKLEMEENILKTSMLDEEEN